MSRERSVLAALFLAWGGALGCSSYATIKTVPIDCAAEDPYQIDPVDMTTAFSYGDPTPGSAITAAVTMLPDGARCGATSALLVAARHFNDWGAAAGFYGFLVNGNPRDESSAEGMAFWARAPGATGKSFTIVLDDFNTYDPTPRDPNTLVDPNTTDSNCIVYATPDGGVQGGTGPAYDPATGMAVSSGTTTITPPNACGNGYQVIMSVANDWRFYTIPWSRFQQTNMSNRVPNSALEETGSAQGTPLLTNKLMLLTLRVPREVETDLWIDRLGFYRKRGVVTGDGGADAR